MSNNPTPCDAENRLDPQNRLDAANRHGADGLAVCEVPTCDGPNPKGGPRTPEGKAKSALNNLQHGLAGAFRIVGNESQRDFDALLAALTAEHCPASPTQLILVEKMAEHLWLARRAQRLQDFALTEDDLKRLAVYLRYQTTNDRAFHKCFNELRRLKKEPSPEQREFESQKRDAARQAEVRLANARAEKLEYESQNRRKPKSSSDSRAFQPANPRKSDIELTDAGR